MMWTLLDCPDFLNEGRGRRYAVLKTKASADPKSERLSETVAYHVGSTFVEALFRKKCLQ